MAEPTTEIDKRSERFDLKTLYETSRLLSASLDLDFVANNLLLSAMSKLFTTRGCVWLYDDATGGYSVRAVKGAGSLDKCDATEEDFAVSDILTGEDVPRAFFDKRIRLVAPILFGDRRIGMLGLGGKATGSSFTDREIEFVSSLVNMSSAAIENSIVVEQLRQANRELDSHIQQLHTLFDLSQEFNATIDRDRLVRLLSLTLMGQMLVSRHIVALSRDGSQPGEVPEGDIQTVTSRGLSLEASDHDNLRKLFRLREPLNVAATTVASAATGVAATSTPTGDTGDVATEPDIEDSTRAWLKDQKVSLVLPVIHQGATCGLLCLGQKQTRQPYAEADVEFLSALANLFIVSMQNSFLVAERIEKERLEEEMRLAREIQEKLQPAEMPKVEGLDLALIAMPSRHVAGDYVDVQPLDDNRVLTAIGDVTGKGLPASLLMSNVQACLHMVLPMDMTLEQATGHMNRVICANTGYDKFITYFHGIYYPDTREFKYVNAGHNPPLLIRANGEAEELDVGGLLLGVMASMPYDLGTTTLHPGDVLVMFTDGATEAMDPQEEEFGEDRLTDAIRKHQELPAQEILNALVRDIEAFVGGSPTQFDDLTMIVMKAVE